MVKKKNNEKKVVWLMVVGILFGMIIFNTYSVDNLRNDLKSVPREVCHIEESVRKVELRPVKLLELSNYAVKDFVVIEDNEKATCVGNVHMDSWWNWYENWGNETATCLITTSKEICEIKVVK